MESYVRIHNGDKKVAKKIKEECRFSIWDNGFWEELYRDYRNKVIEI